MSERQVELNKRLRMKKLCEQAGSIPKAAEILSTATRRPVSVDTIKSWTCDPDTGRARPAQDWALKILDEELAKINKTGPAADMPAKVAKPKAAPVAKVAPVAKAAKKAPSRRAAAVKA